MDDKKLKKRFCKDFDVKIQVFDEPIFSDRLELFSASEKYVEFCNFINELGTPGKYFDICDDVQNKAIEYIQNSEAYKNLMEGDSTGYVLGSNVSSLKTYDVYRVENCGKHLISIDLVKANFSALVYHSRMSGKEFFDSYDYGKFSGTIYGVWYAEGVEVYKASHLWSLLNEATECGGEIYGCGSIYLSFK